MAAFKVECLKSFVYLGLGIYDSDSEDSSAESEDEPSTKKENGVNSDEELRVSSNSI